MVRGSMVTFAGGVSTSGCGTGVSVTVALRKNGRRPGKMAVRVKVSTGGRGRNSRDVDNLVVRCVPG